MKAGLSGTMRWTALALAALLAACGGGAGDDGGNTGSGGVGGGGGGGDHTAALKLHVASPDWRDQIIYFVMTDRFNDGDPANNDQGAGEYDPADNAKFNGGDLKGLAQKIDYIQGLGATAVWITPPVANQWWDPQVQYGGYHGYWAQNFMEVDKHLGTLDDYKALSDQLHRSGMYLVQDVVVNHMGNFFSYGTGWTEGDPAQGLRLNPASVPVAAPTQAPFHQIDPRDASFRDAAIYHWTPSITDYEDPARLYTHQLSDLDDLNTGNPAVRDALRRSHGYWIKEVGVDAFRMDTVFYVEPDFFKDFMHNAGSADPGMVKVAQSTGRKDFFAFGEGFATDRPYTDASQRRIDSYMTDPATQEDILPGMIHFTLYGTAGDVFARGRPTAELAYRIRRTMELHKRPHLMPTFLDNHDVNRFLQDGNVAGLQQGLLMMMTLPGIPVIYYGTEQGYTEQRAAMFRAGYKSGGRDRFDTGAPLYQYIATAAKLRKDHKVFSRGVPAILKDNAGGPGVLAYRMSHEGVSAYVVFNTADSEALLDNMATGLAPGRVLRSVFSAGGGGQDLVAGPDGAVTLQLPPRAARVWIASDDTAVPPGGSRTIELAALQDEVQNGDFTVSGRAGAGGSFKLVVDADVAHAQTVTPSADGSWSATVDTGTMMDPQVRHAVVAWDEATGAVSASRGFRVVRHWQRLVEVADPAGDDTGPTGAYRYPTNDTWGENHQLDIRKVTVSGARGALKLDVQVNKVTTSWNPQNGFDHVAFTVFVEVPGRAGGLRLMPQQNASLPGGMAWHYRLRAHGWSNAFFTSVGASASAEGTPAGPAAVLSVDKASHTISFVLSDSALGKLQSLSGVKVYVTTWDYDGGYRMMHPQAREYEFGGADGRTAPLVMDDTAVIALP